MMLTTEIYLESAVQSAVDEFPGFSWTRRGDFIRVSSDDNEPQWGEFLNYALDLSIRAHFQ